MIERIFIEPETNLYGNSTYDPVNGAFGVPGGNGLGLEPDTDVLKTYRV